LTAQLADRVIAVSEEVREYSIAHTRIAPDKVCTIVNGVQVERFSSDNPQDGLLRQELGIPPHAPLIGIVGRLIPVKDHEVFLQAAASICQELPEARFLIVGDGPLRSTLAAVSAALGLSEAVVFCGLRNDIPSVMASLDLLVFSSRSEGLPVAMLEGMASARAIVATAVGGMPGVMIDGATGLLVPPADPAALARACLQILRDPAAAARMGHAGRMRVQAHYSIAAMVQQTKQLYETLLNQRGLGLAPQPA
jgi:glycosyltransferase involved in cell wall biosynthesis